jgi:NAD(P)H-nitrite reductase large subunit
MKYVVIGASAAGMNALRTLRQLAPEDSLTLISKDEYIHSRCILHHYLEGIRDIPQLNFMESDFIEKNHIDWKKGVAVTGLDPANHELYLSDQTTVTYDKLLLATGASTNFPPVTNLKIAKNVIGLRNLDDAITIKKEAQKATNIVVMGAGLVGIDAVTGLLHYGKNLALVEFGAHMLQIQLDDRAAQTYQAAFQKAGVTQYYSTAAKEAILDEQGAIAGLLLSTGETIACDYLIVATGVRSNVQFLADTALATDRFGLLFDEFGQTNDPDIYGAGDVSGRNPIWPAAVKEGIIAATNMVGQKRALADFFASKSTMTFLNIHTMSLGVPNPPDESYTVDIRETPTSYKKVIHKDGRIYGALIQDDLAYAGILTQLVKKQILVDQLHKSIFDINYSDFFDLKDNLEFTYAQEAESTGL